MARWAARQGGHTTRPCPPPEKAELRAVRRSTHLSSSVDKQLSETTTTAQWAHFLLRAEEELRGVLTLEDVDPIKRRDEFLNLRQMCQEAIASASAMPAGVLPTVRRVILLRAPGRAPRRPRGDAQDGVGRSCSSVDDALGLLSSSAAAAAARSARARGGASGEDALADAAAAPPDVAVGRPTYPPGTALRPGFDPAMLLSAKALAWLLLPQWASAEHARACGGDAVGAPSTPPAGPADDEAPGGPPIVRLVNCWIYCHLNSRAAGDDGDASLPGTDPTAADLLRAHYHPPAVPSPPGSDAPVQTVSSTIGGHRQAASSLLTSLPDVLEADQGSLFGAASVAQLLETPEFASAFPDARRPARKSLTRLYVKGGGRCGA